MPIIATGKETMHQSIKSAFAAAKDSGSQDGADPAAIIDKLSNDIAAAVDSYVTSITVVINPGIPVATAGALGPAAGATTGPGSS